MKRTIAATASAAGLALVLSGCGQGGESQVNDDGSWSPSDTLEVAVGAQPGGGSDILGRALVQGIEELTDASAVVENYDTVEGVLLLKNKPGDAEIVGVGNYSNMVARPHEQDVGYGWKDFTQLAIVAEDVSYVVGKEGAFESAEDMISAAQEGSLTVGQVGSGASDSLVTDQMEKAFDFTLDPVVYEGGGDVVRGLLSGDLDLGVMEPSEFLPQVEAGELDVVLSTGNDAAEAELLADVPLAKDLGADQPFSTQWRVIFGAPELDESQQEYWVDTLEQWHESEGYSEYIESNLLTPLFLTGDELEAFIIDSEKTLLEDQG